MSERSRGFLDVVANICSLVNKVKSEAIVWSSQVSCIARQMESTTKVQNRDVILPAYQLGMQRGREGGTAQIRRKYYRS